MTHEPGAERPSTAVSAELLQPVARRRFLEVAASGPEARSHGVGIDPEGACDFGDGEMLELGEHEDFPLVLVESLDHASSEARRLDTDERLVWPAVARIGERFGIRAGRVEVGALAAHRPPVLGHDAPQDGKHPSFARPSSVLGAKLIEPPRRDPEYVLDHVVHAGVFHPEAARAVEREFDVRLVKVGERHLGPHRRLVPAPPFSQTAWLRRPRLLHAGCSGQAASVPLAGGPLVFSCSVAPMASKRIVREHIEQRDAAPRDTAPASGDGGAKSAAAGGDVMGVGGGSGGAAPAGAGGAPVVAQPDAGDGAARGGASGAGGAAGAGGSGAEAGGAGAGAGGAGAGAGGVGAGAGGAGGAAGMAGSNGGRTPTDDGGARSASVLPATRAIHARLRSRATALSRKACAPRTARWTRTVETRRRPGFARAGSVFGLATAPMRRPALVPITNASAETVAPTVVFPRSRPCLAAMRAGTDASVALRRHSTMPNPFSHRLSWAGALASVLVGACSSDHVETGPRAGGNTTAAGSTTGTAGATSSGATTGDTSGGAGGVATAAGAGGGPGTGAGGRPGTGGAGGGPVTSGCNATDMSGIARPFGSHRFAYAKGSILPSGSRAGLDDATSAFYQKWKALYVDTKGCSEGAHIVFHHFIRGREVTVSEAMGYGMVILPMMAGSRRRRARHLRLHARVRSGACRQPRLARLEAGEVRRDLPSDADDSATDGDLDVAFSDLLADKQWGSTGSASTTLPRRRNGSPPSRLTTSSRARTSRTSATSPARTRRARPIRDVRFISARSRRSIAFFSQTITDTYAVADHIQSKYSSKTGLIPDYLVNVGSADPAPTAPGTQVQESTFTDSEVAYNSCRVPWHLGTDFLVSGDPRAKKAADAINRWVQAATAGDPNRIIDGYKLDGTPGSLDPADYAPDPPMHGSSLAFSAPFAVAAMTDAANQAWLDALWKWVAVDRPTSSPTTTTTATP